MKNGRLTLSSFGDLSIECASHIVHDVIFEICLCEGLPDIRVFRLIRRIDIVSATEVSAPFNLEEKIGSPQSPLEQLWILRNDADYTPEVV